MSRRAEGAFRNQQEDLPFERNDKRGKVLSISSGAAAPTKEPAAASPASKARSSRKSTLQPEEKLLLSRREAAQVLSISERGLDYLVADRRLPTRRIGGRVLIPKAELRKYARADHPERIMDREDTE